MDDATALARLVRSGEASARELAEAAIARIEELNPRLNAVIAPLFEKGLAAADGDLPDGPFRGVPLLVKDLGCFTAGDPLHEGMSFLKDLGWTEERDSWLAGRFREAGMVILGRTNTPELGILPTTEPEAHGPTRNPWDHEHSPGGSSGGSAAAVASGMVAAAHANDGGGSIRIPASHCGLVGLKPTRARVSQGPEIGEAWAGGTIDGAVTRTVRDAAAILDAISAPMTGEPYYAPPLPGPLRDEVGRDPGSLRVGFVEGPG